MYTSIDIDRQTPKTAEKAKPLADLDHKFKPPSMPGYFDRLNLDQYINIWTQAPESTKHKVVFPWHKKCKEYSMIDFHPAGVGNRIAYNDMTSVIQSLKQIKLYDSESMIRSQRFNRNLAIILPLLTMIGMVIGFAEHIQFHLGPSINIGWMLIPIILFQLAWIFVITKALNRRFEKIMMKRQTQVTQILDCWNENFFGPKGLHLSSGLFGAWIELEILYGQDSIYMPVQDFNDRCSGLMKNRLDSILEVPEDEA